MPFISSLHWYTHEQVSLKAGTGFGSRFWGSHFSHLPIYSLVGWLQLQSHSGLQVKAIYQQGHPAVGLSQFGEGVEMRRYVPCLVGSPDWLGYKKSHTIKTVLMMIMKKWQLFVIEHLYMSDIGACSRLCKLSPILRLTLQCQYYDFHFIDRNLWPKKPGALPEAVQAGLELKFKARPF